MTHLFKKPILPSKGEWTELPGIIGLGMTSKYDQAKGLVTSLCYRFKLWTGAKKYMSLEIPGIHPQIFQKLMAAFAHAKKQLDDTGFTSFGKDEYKCDECGTKTFLVATDHRIEATILLHLICADCGAAKDIMCKVIPKLSLLEEKPGEEEGKKQSSKNPHA